MHPLSGSNLGTLMTVLARNGGASPRHWGQVAGILGSVLGRMPFTLAERMVTARRLRDLPADLPPPVFILGHWRSGTTHLYNVLSRDPQFGYLAPLPTGMPWEMLTLVPLIRPLLERQLPQGRYIDNVAVTPDSPQEDEIALANMQPLSYYHALYFPGRFQEQFDKAVFLDGVSERELSVWKERFLLLCRKLTVESGGKPLLIKNPVYTARVALLREMFPEARFIHVHRDPVRIFESMRNFYHKLFPPMALQPYDHVDVDAVVLNTYGRMMERMLADVADLPADRYAEIGFETFEQQPVAELERVYGQLGLDGWEAAAPLFSAYLEGVSGYRKNTYREDPETASLVARHWGPYVQRWGRQVQGA
ncbi:sulfotransferase family protein [Caenispirillum salinarum]|uniref:sulfotransferase family protein n=1 Tax=Caenispirillum salinarum TaxID=859058 RepID=UPI00384BC7FB